MFLKKPKSNVYNISLHYRRNQKVMFITLLYVIDEKKVMFISLLYFIEETKKQCL